MLERYLHDLEREMARSLPPEDLPDRVAEAEAHLREDVQARVELGTLLAEAEREAVAAFGQMRQVAKAQIPGRQVPAKLRCILLGSGFVVATAFLLFGYAAREAYPQSLVVAFSSWIGLGFALAVASFRARHPVSLPLLRTGLVGATAVWLTIGLGWLDLGPYGGGGVVPPGQRKAMRADMERLLRERTADVASFDADLRAVRGAQGIEAFRVSGGYRAPVAKGNWSYDECVAYTTLASPFAAQKAWRDVDRRARGEFGPFDVRLPIRQIRAIDRAAADPVGGLVNGLTDTGPACLGVTFLALLVDRLFASLGAWAARLRNRRMGVA